MKTVIQLLFFLFLFKLAPAQIELLKKNKVSKCTVYRARLYPDTIGKEIYEYVVFNKAGNIIERYRPYDNSQLPLDRYYYDSLEKLIKYVGFNKNGIAYESWEWKSAADSFDRNKFTPEPWFPHEYNWQESFNNWTKSGALRNAKIKIDTISISKKGINKLIRVIVLRDISVDTINFYFGKYIRRQEQVRDFRNGKINTHTIEFNSKGRMTERFPINLPNEQPPYHFFYEYNKKGLIKKVISRYADNKIAERLDYIYEYY